MSLLRKLAGLRFALLVSLAVASIVAVTVRVADEGEGSSHREAPLISADPLADQTDQYAFIAPDSPDKVTLVGNWIPLEEPAGGPNFYNFGDDVYYEFNIDNDGDAVEDVIYSFKFRTVVQNPGTFLYATGPITSLSDTDFNIRQYYDVSKKTGNGPWQSVAKNLPVPPNNIGPVSTPGYDALASAAIANLPGGVRAFAGQRDDPFFVDLGAVFDLATIRVLPGNAGGGIDNVAGFNTHSIVLQVPISHVTACGCSPASADHPSAVIGVWGDTYRNQVNLFGKKGGKLSAGQKVQVSRLGIPLVNEVVIPLSHKDTFNGSEPEDDTQFLSFVTDPGLAAGLNAIYDGIVTPIPASGRTDLVTVFLTGIEGLNQPPDVVPSEQIRLNVAIKPATCGAAKRLGVIAGDNCGFPNGRRLADDVTDVALRAVACGYGFDLHPCVDSAPNNLLGDGVDRNDKAFLMSFPYVPSPHSGFNSPHNTTPVPPLMMGLGAGGGVFLLLLGLSVLVGKVRRRSTAA